MSLPCARTRGLPVRRQRGRCRPCLVQDLKGSLFVAAVHNSFHSAYISNIMPLSHTRRRACRHVVLHYALRPQRFLTTDSRIPVAVAVIVVHATNVARLNPHPPVACHPPLPPTNPAVAPTDCHAFACADASRTHRCARPHSAGASTPYPLKHAHWHSTKTSQRSDLQP